jgi:hypothetical protein
MNIKKFTSFAFGLGMAFSFVSAQNCSVLSESINQDFTGMTHGTRPACWVSHHHPTISGTFSGVYNGDQRYYLEWHNGGYPQNSAQVRPFVLAMQRCTMRGPLSFSVWQLFNAPSRSLEVGTMSDPNNPATFTPFQTINHFSGTPATYTVDFTGYIGTDKYIAFRSFMSNGNGFSIDNIVWSGPPAVVTPVMPPKGF